MENSAENQEKREAQDKIEERKERISLYIPYGKQISDVINTLRDEYGTAGNIKDEGERKRVQERLLAIAKFLNTIKIVPPNGLAIFSGYIFFWKSPKKPVTVYLLRRDRMFHREYLEK